MISSHPISFVCESEGLIFQDDEKIIGRWFDWADGLSELQNANLPLRTGSVLLIAKDRINEIIQEDGGTFCWLCEIKVFSRDHSIGEFKEQSFTHIIGAGKLIQSTQFGLLSSPS
jgi:hypothetical protein